MHSEGKWLRGGGIKNIFISQPELLFLGIFENADQFLYAIFLICKCLITNNMDL